MEVGGEQLEPIVQKMINLAQSKPKGICDQDISIEMPDLLPEQKRDVINKLLKLNYLRVFKQGKVLLYKLNDPSNTKVVKGADNEEKVVFCIIEEAGNKGIWVREIRNKCNLPATQLAKILKSLEQKKIIKAVKSVAASKKKVYMLFDLEPDITVTGGAWYQDQDFESEFVDILNQQCYRYLEQKRDSVDETVANMGPMYIKRASYATAEEVKDYIIKIKISKVKLRAEDLEMILNTLIYDGKVEKYIAPDKKVSYRAIKPLVDTPGLVKSSCGVCPVRKNCCDFGDITPIKCQYINEWLNS
ncbi:DNA-directed RNA polymerase III subunit RPC6 [Copidosoma floridanum]|uniref:DNA-directed RNA polymerase III subunit RPC6 n=1 Tax=Copidosoma floridanum TaxID=29053 RepID=UPI0006C94486|nr:DNA-directed RNA polymerase III subunit RPC6 [Copidosoma floridanum]